MSDFNYNPKNTKTYDFVRKTGRDRYFAARDREIAMLQDMVTGGIKPEFAEPVNNCPVCGNKVFNTLFKKQGFQFCRCSDIVRCGHIFADPQIKDDVLIEAYHGQGEKRDCPTANDLWIEVLLSKENYHYDLHKYQSGLSAIEKALETRVTGSKRILDVGCSVGHFLQVAREQGWETMGLELNKKAIAYARDTLKLDVRCQLLEEANFPDASFDAVTLWGVIEHLKRPIETLKEIARVLKPGGILLTFSPNADSLVCRVLRDKAATFDGRNHPSYFTPASIRLAVERAGLKNLFINYYQADIDAVLNYLDWYEPYVEGTHPSPSLSRVFKDHINGICERFILTNGLGYKMMTVNRKQKV